MFRYGKGGVYASGGSHGLEAAAAARVAGAFAEVDREVLGQKSFSEADLFRDTGALGLSKTNGIRMMMMMMMMGYYHRR